MKIKMTLEDEEEIGMVLERGLSSLDRISPSDTIDSVELCQFGEGDASEKSIVIYIKDK